MHADAVILQQREQSLAGAGTPGGDNHAPSFALLLANVPAQGIEHRVSFNATISRKAAPDAAAERGDGARARDVAGFEGRELVDGAALQSGLPQRRGEEHFIRRHRLIGIGAERGDFARFDTRIVMLSDLRVPFVDGLIGQMIEADRRVGRIVEQGLQLLMKQRQPMLLTGIALTCAHSLVKRIIARGGAEQCHIVLPEAALGVRSESDFAHRHQHDFRHRLQRALRFDVEALDAL